MKRQILIFSFFGIMPIFFKIIISWLDIALSSYFWNYYIWIFGFSLIEVVVVYAIKKVQDKPSPLVILAAKMVNMLAFMIVFLVYAILYNARQVEDALAFGTLSVYFLALSAFILIQIVRKISKSEK